MNTLNGCDCPQAHVMHLIAVPFVSRLILPEATTCAALEFKCSASELSLTFNNSCSAVFQHFGLTK
jgi:hypothetical protein